MARRRWAGARPAGAKPGRGEAGPVTGWQDGGGPARGRPAGGPGRGRPAGETTGGQGEAGRPAGETVAERGEAGWDEACRGEAGPVTQGPGCAPLGPEPPRPVERDPTRGAGRGGGVGRGPGTSPPALVPRAYKAVRRPAGPLGLDREGQLQGGMGWGGVIARGNGGEGKRGTPPPPRSLSYSADINLFNEHNVGRNQPPSPRWEGGGGTHR